MSSFYWKMILKIFVASLSLSFFHSGIFIRGAEVEVEINDDLTSTNSQASGWFSWSSKSSPKADTDDASFSLSTKVDIEESNVDDGETKTSSNLDLLSPYSLLSYLGPDMDSMNLANDVFNMYYYPENTSYLSMASTLLKLLLFFMPGGGILQQAYFIMEMTRITYKVAYMYFTGYDTIEIASTIAPDLLKAVVLKRRDVSYVSEYTFHPGDSVDISSMDANSFLRYVDSIQFPRLSGDQEKEIRKNVENVLDKYFPNIVSSTRDEMIDAFEQTIKFFALLTPNQGIRDSSSSEESESKIDRIIQIIRVLSASSTPKTFISQKFRNLRNLFFKN